MSDRLEIIKPYLYYLQNHDNINLLPPYQYNAMLKQLIKIDKTLKNIAIMRNGKYINNIPNGNLNDFLMDVNISHRSKNVLIATYNQKYKSSIKNREELILRDFSSIEYIDIIRYASRNCNKTVLNEISILFENIGFNFNRN